MIRLAVWGLGPHAFKNILPAIELSGSLELAGFCSRNSAKRDEAAQKWGGISWSSSAAMLVSDEVDVVYVATPTGLHFRHGMTVLQANKHLICEKSLTAEPVEAVTLVSEARARTLVLCEALMFQYHPRAELLQALVRGSPFGKPLHAFCTFGLPPLAQPGFRTDATLGGGAFLDLACYPVCMMRMLFGDDPQVIHAQIYGDGVDTSGSACLAFANGALGNVAWGYNRAYAAEIIAIGEGQSVYANRLFSKESVDDSIIILRDQAGYESRPAVPRGNSFVSMFEVVVRSITDSVAREQLYARAEAQSRLMKAIRLCAA